MFVSQQQQQFLFFKNEKNPVGFSVVSWGFRDHSVHHSQKARKKTSPKPHHHNLTPHSLGSLVPIMALFFRFLLCFEKMLQVEFLDVVKWNGTIRFILMFHIIKFNIIIISVRYAR
jgi:hypothetical protein